MHMEFRAKKNGDYIWAMVFIGKGLDYALAHAGTLRFNPDEWEHFKENVRFAKMKDLDITCWEWEEDSNDQKTQDSDAENKGIPI